MIEDNVESAENRDILSLMLRDAGEALGGDPAEAAEAFPNNAGSGLPLLLYRQVMPIRRDDDGQALKRLFRKNSWGTGLWSDEGVYDYHHYHTVAHEALGCYAGEATIRFGGDVVGETVEFKAGDVVVIPAGVAHKRLYATPDFRVVGAYPSNGPEPDMNYGKPGERPAADRCIAAVRRPAADPVYGAAGPLIERWHSD